MPRMVRTRGSAHPYSVTEQNFTIRRFSPRRQSPRRVLHPRPRSDQLPLRTRPRRSAQSARIDAGGGWVRNVLKSVAIGYGRAQPDHLPWQADRAKQTQTLITYTENGVTNAIDIAEDDYRVPFLETRTYELTGLFCDRRGRPFHSDVDFAEPVSRRRSLQSRARQ